MSKTVIITGTSSGFGKQMSIALAGEGYNVIAAMRNITGKNKIAADELNVHANITVVEMDVTSTSSVQAAFESALGKFGRIDVLINNAGVSGFGFLEATSVEQMKKIFEANVWGAIRCHSVQLPLWSRIADRSF